MLRYIWDYMLFGLLCVIAGGSLVILGLAMDVTNPAVSEAGYNASNGKQLGAISFGLAISVSGGMWAVSRSRRRLHRVRSYSSRRLQTHS